MQDLEFFKSDNVDWNLLFNQILAIGLGFLGKVFLFLLILVIGFWLSGVIERKFMKQRRIHLVNPTVQSFFRSFLKIGMKVAVLIIAVRSIGVDGGSIIAVVGSAGLAIGLALQGSLSNLASGVLILTNKPFVVDDYIEFGQSSGTCVSIGLFYTRLKTPDGKAVYVPNSMITTSVLVNYSLYPERRMDIQFGVGYDTDLERLREILMRIAREHPNIIIDPAPVIAVIDFAAYSLTIRFRFFTASEAYWDCYHELYALILEELRKEEIEIPFPRYVIDEVSASKVSTPKVSE